MPVPAEKDDPQPRTPDNDILAMLRLNKEREAERAINQPIEYVPKKSRRRRDYILCMVVSNLLILATMIVYKTNVVVLIYGFSGIILLSAGLTWVMFFVMEDY